MAVITTWDIAPDYDAWGSDTWWGCTEWMQWHGQLKKKFGAEKAKMIWDYAFAKSGNFSGNLDCRTTNKVFREYVRKEGLNPYQNAGVFAPILNIVGGGLELGESAGDVVGGAAEGVSSIGKYIKYGLGVAVLGVAVLYGIKAYKLLK